MDHERSGWPGQRVAGFSMFRAANSARSWTMMGDAFFNALRTALGLSRSVYSSRLTISTDSLRYVSASCRPPVIDEHRFLDDSQSVHLVQEIVLGGWVVVEHFQDNLTKLDKLRALVQV